MSGGILSNFGMYFRLHALTVVFYRKTTRDVLLQLSRALPACELQRTGVSALQQAGGRQIRETIVGEAERVGERVPSS